MSPWSPTPPPSPRSPRTVPSADNAPFGGSPGDFASPRDRAERRALRPALVLGAGLVALGLLWRLAPPLEALSLEALRQSALAPVLATLAVFLGSLLLAPILLLTTLAAMALGPATGFACALMGAMASAIAGFAIGRALGRAPVQWLASRWDRAARVLEALRDHGLKTVVVARVVPVLLYGLVSIACGAMGLRWRPYLLGTLLGMAPVLAAACLFGEGLTRLLRADTVLQALPLALGLAAVLLVARKAWAWLTARRSRS